MKIAKHIWGIKHGVLKTRNYFAFINVSLCGKKKRSISNLVLIMVIVHHQQSGKLEYSDRTLTTSLLIRMTSLPRLCPKTVAKLLVRLN